MIFSLDDFAVIAVSADGAGKYNKAEPAACLVKDGKSLGLSALQVVELWTNIENVQMNVAMKSLAAGRYQLKIVTQFGKSVTPRKKTQECTYPMIFSVVA